MKITESVFGSKSERNLFKTLHSRWSKEFDLWPSLPFSRIIEMERVETALSTRELDYFYKTNVSILLYVQKAVALSYLLNLMD
jgi:hypothetical protein